MTVVGCLKRVADIPYRGAADTQAALTGPHLQSKVAVHGDRLNAPRIGADNSTGMKPCLSGGVEQRGLIVPIGMSDRNVR